MQRNYLSYLILCCVLLGFISCSSDDENAGGNDNPLEIPLVEHNNKILGWGKG